VQGVHSAFTSVYSMAGQVS